DVVNVGAAGTFVIRKTASRVKLLAEVTRRLPFEAEVMICGGSDVLRWASAEPFAGESSGPNIVRFVTVLAKRGRVSPQVPLSLPSGGEWSLRILAHEGQFVFGVYRREMNDLKYLSQLEYIF